MLPAILVTSRSFRVRTCEASLNVYDQIKVAGLVLVVKKCIWSNIFLPVDCKNTI